MFDKLFQRYQRLLLIISILIWLLFNLLLFPYFSPLPEGASLTILDVRLFYSSSDVMELFLLLGEGGRASYLFQLLFIDMFYPVIYAVMLSLLLYLLSASYGKWSHFVPFLAAGADVSENVLIAAMLLNFPEIPDLLVWFATEFTMIKWLLVALSVFILILSLFFRLLKQLRTLNR